MEGLEAEDSPLPCRWKVKPDVPSNKTVAYKVLNFAVVLLSLVYGQIIQRLSVEFNHGEELSGACLDGTLIVHTCAYARIAASPYEGKV